MVRKRFEDELDAIVRPETEGLGYTLWGISVSTGGGKKKVLIFIDGPDGVTIDACAEVSRQVGLALEMEDAIPGAYTLEVSSPGLERRFFNVGQMAAYAGQTIDVRLWQAREGKRNYSGTLAETNDDSFVLETDKGPETFHWDDVKQARLVHTF
ncbi:ribosome maturation factor RimP [Salidesulfovibrio brasiliensis]|uniref:ribosome maturation factor RimP n=1 Tax=Salidesulfovibrio brasiliensis TaxID=221711 RepID=UPI0006D0288B|nr:ribosome maturation factor RimP [Salidesulfovibrio brasiliensis]